MTYKTLKVLVPDTVHFHEKNFKSLMGFFLRHNITLTKNDEVNSWASLYGDYSTKLVELQPYLAQLKRVKKTDLFEFSYKNINVWAIARAELLTWFLPKIEFNIHIAEKNDKDHFKLMYAINEGVVANCYAAVMFFLDYWKKKLASIRVQSHALIYSGSQIYNRTLLEVLKHSQTTPIVMEHFFTGNEYYFEERYTPIANSTDLRHAYYKPEKSIEYDRLRIKATNKVLKSNNRNVKKTGDHLNINFESGKTVGLIGQVVNDYSIIETATNYLNSVAFYKEFITKSTTNGINVVFKAHPWEKHKDNVRTSFTKDMLEQWAETELTAEQQARLIITESVDMDCIFNQVDYVVGLCSQGLLEACFEGFKPVQFGNAFYSGRSFTNDYALIDSFISAVNEMKINGTLGLDEYKRFEDFLVEALEKQLISVHKSGILSIENKLKAYPLIPLVENRSHLPQKITHQEIETALSSKVIVNSYPNKKLKKLKNDPKSFLKDSNYGFLRALSKAVS
ncbi:MAG: hypothetical protein ACJA13_000266 [Paraglaciecola sp.]|jgi:hypothetical protein